MQQKDEHAFTLLYNKYYVPLCQKAFQRIPVNTLVEEIVQDVFIALWTKAPELDVNRNIGAWLFATLRNKVLAELRTEGRRRKYQEIASSLHPMVTDGQSENKIDTKRLTETALNTIKSLPDQCKHAFVLSRFEHRSYKEIADIMSISVSTVEKHIIKALSIMRAELGNNEYSLAIILLSIQLCNQ